MFIQFFKKQETRLNVFYTPQFGGRFPIEYPPGGGGLVVGPRLSVTAVVTNYTRAAACSLVRGSVIFL